MPDSIEPDILYGQTPGSSHPLWVAVFKDLPHAVAVLERYGFGPTMIGDLELFALPEETGTQLSAELHLASYAELANAGYTVLSTPAHPALPIEQLGRIERRTALGAARPLSAAPVAIQGVSPGNPTTAIPAAKPAVPDTFRRPPTRGGS
ncbi:hypothetical protein [Streptomyces sp. NBC_00096]|uniref:hypothetical protein n=1 Tax=Streptomyces sp. NBC_00096 TaxID=2975650 RepID=UPI003249C32F